MTVTTSEETFGRVLDGLADTAFLAGCTTMRFRIIRMLMSMGERDLASTVGRMDIPTRENANGAAAPQETA